MQTIKIEGAIWARKFKFEKDFHFAFYECKDPDDPYLTGENGDTGVLIAPYTIEIEADGDIRQMMYKKTTLALQNQRKLILAENQKRLNEIEAMIANHLAIENKAEG